MSTSKIDTGKTWVVAALISHARKAGFIVVAPQFVPSEGEQREMMLDFQVAGRTYQERFRAEDLESCSSVPQVRTRLTLQIKKLVKSL